MSSLDNLSNTIGKLTGIGNQLFDFGNSIYNKIQYGNQALPYGYQDYIYGPTTSPNGSLTFDMGINENAMPQPTQETTQSSGGKNLAWIVLLGGGIIALTLPKK